MSSNHLNSNHYSKLSNEEHEELVRTALTNYASYCKKGKYKYRLVKYFNSIRLANCYIELLNRRLEALPDRMHDLLNEKASLALILKVYKREIRASVDNEQLDKFYELVDASDKNIRLYGTSNAQGLKRVYRKVVEIMEDVESDIPSFLDTTNHSTFSMLKRLELGTWTIVKVMNGAMTMKELYLKEPHVFLHKMYVYQLIESN